MKKILYYCAAVGCGLLLFLLGEGGLWLAGVVPLAQEDLFAGFSAQTRVFLPDSSGVYRLNPSMETYFNGGQSFRMPKPEGVFRIIAVGGSTTYGRPWLGDTAFPAWMKRLLEQARPGLAVEAINMGGISYASYRVSSVVDEALGYDPDQVVVYAGHNEFLEERTFAAQKYEPKWRQSLRAVLHHSRVYSLLYRGISQKISRPQPPGGESEDVEATLEKIGGPELYHRDERFRQKVIEQYRSEITAIIGTLQSRNVNVVLCTLPSNLAGISPFKSEFRDGLSVREQDQFVALVNQAEKALRGGRAQDALAALARAEQIDDRYAYLYYLEGVAMEGLGRYLDAYAAYEKAKEEDIVPLRALNEFNAILRELSRQQRVPLADVEAAVRGASPHGIPGNVWFADHVHPTIAGQQLVAWEVIDAATREGVAPISLATWNASKPEAETYLSRSRENLSADYVALGYWGVGRLYFWAGKYDEAYEPLEKAWRTIRDVAEIPRQLAAIHLMRGEYPEALKFVSQALRIAPGDLQAGLLEARALAHLGQVDRALQHLESLQVADHDSLQVQRTRADILLLSKRYAEASTILAELVRREDRVASLHYDYAVALRGTGRMRAAEYEYRRWSNLTGRAVDEQELLAWLTGKLPEGEQ